MLIRKQELLFCGAAAWMLIRTIKGGGCLEPAAGAALYRTSMLNDIGLFDEGFFLLYEDVDLSFRAQLKGYKCLYVPEAIVYHKGSSSIVHDSPTSVYYSHRNLEWVYIQNMPFRLIIKSIIPHLIYDFVAFVYFVVRGRGNDYVRAKRDALIGLRRALQKRREVQRGKVVDDRYLLTPPFHNDILDSMPRHARLDLTGTFSPCHHSRDRKRADLYAPAIFIYLFRNVPYPLLKMKWNE